jgi:hypothetical protein
MDLDATGALPVRIVIKFCCFSLLSDTGEQSQWTVCRFVKEVRSCRRSFRPILCERSAILRKCDSTAPGQSLRAIATV